MDKRLKLVVIVWTTAFVSWIGFNVFSTDVTVPESAVLAAAVGALATIAGIYGGQK